MAHDLNGPELQTGLGGTPLQILVAFNGGSIEGLVDDREAAAGATVVLVPDSSRRFIQSDYKATVTKSNGAFSLKGVPPGVYQLFAWESIPDTAWLNPDFMSRLEGRGQVVSMEAAGVRAFESACSQETANGRKMYFENPSPEGRGCRPSLDGRRVRREEILFFTPHPALRAHPLPSGEGFTSNRLGPDREARNGNRIPETESESEIHN
jgi:hypothetical protein